MFDLVSTSLFGTADSAMASVSTPEFLMCCAASIVLGAACAAIYMFRHNYSKNFVVTLALLPLIVQMVITLVNGNLGAGIAVMGVFNLVRFRSIPGSAKDIGSVFLAMAIGLATGMGFIGLAVLFTRILKHTNLTWGFAFSYPNLSQVASFFGIRGCEVLGELLGRRAQIMVPRHARQLVPHEQFERGISDAPFELSESSPRVAQVRERYHAEPPPHPSGGDFAHRLRAHHAQPLEAVGRSLVAHAEERVAVRLGHDGLAHALPVLRAPGYFPIQVSNLLVD